MDLQAAREELYAAGRAREVARALDDAEAFRLADRRRELACAAVAEAMGDEEAMERHFANARALEDS